jgi:hypothetical protein
VNVTSDAEVVRMIALWTDDRSRVRRRGHEHAAGACVDGPHRCAGRRQGRDGAEHRFPDGVEVHVEGVVGAELPDGGVTVAVVPQQRPDLRRRRRAGRSGDPAGEQVRSAGPRALDEPLNLLPRVVADGTEERVSPNRFRWTFTHRSGAVICMSPSAE